MKIDREQKDENEGVRERATEREMHRQTDRQSGSIEWRKTERQSVCEG